MNHKYVTPRQAEGGYYTHALNATAAKILVGFHVGEGDDVSIENMYFLSLL